MKRFSICICVIFAVLNNPSNLIVAQGPHKEITDYDRVSGLTFEQEKPRLDQFAAKLKDDPTTRAYIIIYGGRVGRKEEARTRAQCSKNYLIAKHGIEPQRITVVVGGYREGMEVELYILLPGAATPAATPTISATAAQAVKKRKLKKAQCN